MGKSWYIRNAFIFICVLYVGLSVFVTEKLVYAITSEQSELTRNELIHETSLMRSRIESLIYAEVFVANSLATILVSDQEFALSRFESLADTLVSKSKYVKHIGISQGYILTHVHPIVDNNEVLGIDFRDFPSLFNTVEEARLKKSVVLAGPLDLIPNGVGLIARYPIFSDYPKNNIYWGGVNVVFYSDRLLKDAGLVELSQHYDVALKSSNLINEEGGLFFGSAETFELADATFTFELPGGKWTLASKMKEGSSAPFMQLPIVIRGFCYFVSIVLLMSAFFLYEAFTVATKISYRDALTDLPNRRFAMEVMEKLVNQRDDTSFSLIAIDVDNFKYINDHYGHEAGDYVLMRVSKRLQSSVRSSDFVFRLGGDEFLILLTGSNSISSLGRIISKLKKVIDNKDFVFKGNELSVSISMGYSRFPDDSRDLDELLSLSDMSMFKDKKSENDDSARIKS